MSNSSNTPLVRMVGFILIVFGGLATVTAGLCTAAFAFGLLGKGNLNDLSGTLSVGIPFMLAGVAVYALGRWLGTRG
jgi:hypothetical protein